MQRTSKSPRTVTLEAFAVGQRTLPEYTHRFSPKKFTQPRLVACLVLKDFLRLDYRGLSASLADQLCAEYAWTIEAMKQRGLA